ncbi:MAG: hypothetical protein AAF959_19570 [Cyanobacteria bacterium P01_D01_bin.56]
MNLKIDRISAGAIAALSLSLGTAILPTETAQAAVLGDSATAVNTFQDSVITGGVETIFDFSGPELVADDLEFPAFASLYDIDISDNSLTMTLVDNSVVASLVSPEGRFDRYYIGFDTSIVTSARLNGSDELNEFANVEVLEPGFSLDIADLFDIGIPVPIEFDNGGLLVELGAGTDVTNLGDTAKVNFTTKSVPEPEATMPLLLVSGLMVARSITRKRRFI